MWLLINKHETMVQREIPFMYILFVAKAGLDLELVSSLNLIRQDYDWCEANVAESTSNSRFVEECE